MVDPTYARHRPPAVSAPKPPPAASAQNIPSATSRPSVSLPLDKMQIELHMLTK